MSAAPDRDVASSVAAAAAASGYLPLSRLLARHGGQHPGKAAIVEVDDAHGDAVPALAQVEATRSAKAAAAASSMQANAGCRTIDFRQLALVVDSVAQQLLNRGVQRGDRVILPAVAGIDTVIMWLALWRMGAIICPLDDAQFDSPAMAGVRASLAPAFVLCPSTGAPRGHTMQHAFGEARVLRFGTWSMRDVGAAAATLGTSAAADGEARGGEVAGIRMPGSANDVIALVSADPGTTVDIDEPAPDDVASMCCTSGSSGMPKIVVHDHLSYWLNGLDSTAMLELDGEDRLLEYRSLGWSSSQILGLIAFLQVGFTLCLARHFSRSHFPAWISQHRITVAAGVPTVINMLLSGPLDGLRAASATLRLITCSSAPLSRETWERFEHATGIALVTLYGSSEAGWITGSRLLERRIGTVGTKTAHADFDIVDGEGRPCGVGEAGQVMVRGPKLALGLLDASGAMVPIVPPVVTNDVAVMDEDGHLRLLGRTDDLIIRGGVKISPSDIEDWLLRLPGVAEAAVLGVPDRIYGSEAVAFVVLQPGAAVTVSAIDLHAAKGLTRDRRPRSVYILDALPRNERGKLRRDVLREHWWSHQVRGRG